MKPFTLLPNDTLPLLDISNLLKTFSKSVSKVSNLFPISASFDEFLSIVELSDSLTSPSDCVTKRNKEFKEESTESNFVKDSDRDSLVLDE